MKLGVYDLAKELGVTHTTVYNWLDEGLPYSRKQKGRRMTIVIDLEMAQEWLKSYREVE